MIKTTKWTTLATRIAVPRGKRSIPATTKPSQPRKKTSRYWWLWKPHWSVDIHSQLSVDDSIINQVWLMQCALKSVHEPTAFLGVKWHRRQNLPTKARKAELWFDLMSVNYGANLRGKHCCAYWISMPWAIHHLEFQGGQWWNTHFEHPNMLLFSTMKITQNPEFPISWMHNQA